MGQKVVLRSDGTSVYITQDMGTTLKKYEDYKPESMIWVVGDEQNLHFQMLFAIMKKLGYNWADQLFHLSYGMVNLPSGKMKSREGTVVDADDLFDEMTSLAAASCRERDTEADDAKIAERGEIIGLGALKFMLLKFNAKTTIMFDPAASIRFEGDTGPYVQYTYARTCSVLSKSGEIPADAKVKITAAEENELVLVMSKFEETVVEAIDTYEPSIVTRYILDLAGAYNRFYHNCSILGAENEEIRSSRILLTKAANQVLGNAFDLICLAKTEKI
jgi:arginyl-tRNA synthetase